MLQALVRTAGRLLDDLNRSWVRVSDVEKSGRGKPAAAVSTRPMKYQPLRQVTLTDEVGRTLFEKFAQHRQGCRSEEETGWLLLGLREMDEAVVLATLPAGTEYNAGVAHVRFNSSGQALASRIVRQTDRRLMPLGVVHTHPGSLRHPSDGDFRGDSAWVRHLRGGEGVFGIGTADGFRLGGASGALFGRQPKPHVQCLGELCLSWYSLREGDHGYRPLPYGLTLGPDLARPLHPLWSTIEAYAEQLDRLYRQQAGVTFEVVSGYHGPTLAVTFPLAKPGDEIRVLLEGKEVRYYLVRHGDLLAVESYEERVDRGVYLLLAELTAPC